jgi:hypothetical protein
MSAQRPTRDTRARTLGVLACALSIPVVALVWSQHDRDDPPAAPGGPIAESSTAPTVLAEELVASTSLPDSPPASPATSLLPDPSVVPNATPTSPPPTLIPPVTVTAPAQRTTTTRPAPATTAPPTTTPAPADE